MRKSKIRRRSFLATSLAVGAGLTGAVSRAHTASAAGSAGNGGAPAVNPGPTVLRRGPSRPVVIASANGNTYKNGGPRTCVHEAFLRMVQGEDVLSALIAGVNIVELDPMIHIPDDELHLWATADPGNPDEPEVTYTGRRSQLRLHTKEPCGEAGNVVVKVGS